MAWAARPSGANNLQGRRDGRLSGLWHAPHFQNGKRDAC